MASSLSGGASFVEVTVYYVEVRPEIKRVGPPVLVPLANAYEHVGFRSVYAYGHALAQHILATGTTRGMQQQSVYSDELFVDFDHSQGEDFLLHLYDEGIQHSVWTTGNRGVHVHVAIEPMEGVAVPDSQAAWVKGNVVGADPSFYIHGGQWRLPGTVHAKTGRLKTKHHELTGRRLEIPLVTPRVAALDGSGLAPTPGRFYQHILRTKTAGGRRQYAWHLATLAWQEGLKYEVALRSILWWNGRYCQPSLPEIVIAERCREAYATGRKQHAACTTSVVAQSEAASR